MGSWYKLNLNSDLNTYYNNLSFGSGVLTFPPLAVNTSIFIGSFCNTTPAYRVSKLARKTNSIYYTTPGNYEPYTSYGFVYHNDYIYKYNGNLFYIYANSITDNYNIFDKKRSIILNGSYIIKYNISDIIQNFNGNEFLSSCISFNIPNIATINGKSVYNIVLDTTGTTNTRLYDNRCGVNYENGEIVLQKTPTIKVYFSSTCKSPYNISDFSNINTLGNSTINFNNAEVHEDFAKFLLAIADPQDQITLTFGDSFILANKPVTEISVVKKTLNLVDVTIDGVTSEVEIHPQEDKVFLGFSLQENATVATIPIGTTKITLNENTVFYEVWGAYKPEPNFFTANFYKNSAESHRVDKTEYLTSVFSAGISLREETNIIYPTILLQYDKVPDFNYCYIEYFGRYYYVTDVTSIRNNIWQISLSVDVLMSFKDTIKTQMGNVIRQENIGNNFMPDNQIPVTGIPKIQFLEFTLPTVIFDNDVANAFDGNKTSVNYVLITQGVGVVE